MSEFEFEVQSVRGSYRAKAQRAAVLTPLVGRTSTPAGVGAALARLRRQWVARLGALAAAGWEPARRDFAYMRNCPPFSVITSTRAVPCKRPRVCPFCYARAVALECFVRIELAVYGTHACRRVDPATGVKEFIRPRPYRLLEVESFDRLPAAAAPEAIVAELRALRRVYPRPVAPDGAYRIDSIEPAACGWLVRRRLLILVDRDRPNPGVIPKKQTEVREHDAISRKVLAGAVGRVLSYPVGMMRGDPGATAAVLGAMDGFRTAVTYGVLRSCTARQDLFEEG